MKDDSCAGLIELAPDVRVPLPAYPRSGTEVFRKLKQFLDETECAQDEHLSQAQFGRLLGMPKSTVNDWTYGSLPKQVRFFLCALERLSEASRTELMQGLCRECPRLDHPWLAHDPDAVNRVKALIARQSGLTSVTGAARRFLWTAIGHSARKIVPFSRLRGADIHTPDQFVPVAGVSYFHQPLDLAQMTAIVRQLFRETECGCAQLILLNGFWNASPEIQKLIIKAAKTRHVIVADDFKPIILRRRKNRNANLIIADASKDARISLRVDLASLIL